MPDIATMAGNVYLSGQVSMLEVGTRFMHRLRALSSFRAAPSTDIRAQAGGAAAVADRYRVWFEGYGMGSRTDAAGRFPGDRRTTYGGLAGAGVTVAPGLNAGLSVDQGRTNIDVTGLAAERHASTSPRSARSSHTKAARGIEAPTLIHGFGDVHSSRVESGGESTAAYQAELWGGDGGAQLLLGAAQHTRLVPKLTFDWTQSRTDAFVEVGGVDADLRARP